MLLELNFRSKSEARWMNLERKAHSSIIIKHRCQNNLQHPQDPRNQNLKDDNANKPHKKKKKKKKKNPKKQINTNKQKRNLDWILFYTKFVNSAARGRTEVWGRNQRKFPQTETKEEEAKKQTKKKGRTLPTHARLKAKKCVQCAKRGGKRWEREKEERDIRTFLFPSKSCYILPIQVRERGRDKRETL